jgi:hypothetical protein
MEMSVEEADAVYFKALPPLSLAGTEKNHGQPE